MLSTPGCIPLGSPGGISTMRRFRSNLGFESPELWRSFACGLICLICVIASRAQLPYMNAGPDSAFAQIDFAQMYLDQQNREMQGNAEQREGAKKLVSSGLVSALDLSAPNKAVDEFNRAASLMKAQNSKEAIKHLQKAISDYPKFVSAHNALGLAYLDQNDPRAVSEFEAAASLDDKFPGSFVNLGLLALSNKSFKEAESALEKAAALTPEDAKTLSALAFAQNGNHEYAQVLDTAQRVHRLDHRGMANVHYIAASAAVALNQLDVVQNQLTVFLGEDPTNPLAPTARQNLAILSRRKAGTVVAAHGESQAVQTFPNSDRLKAQLEEATPASDRSPCEKCASPTTTNIAEASIGTSLPSSLPVANTWTIHQTVEETTLFFAVSNRGHMINDLTLADFQIRDNDKPPVKITQFISQSKLPLRIGLLIDTSGSVKERFSFEKRAAAKFLEKMINPSSDLGFVIGFNSQATVTQDFTAQLAELDHGIQLLKNGGGTSLFDAASLGCWKLSAYPDNGRVARVLVILSDGEDNSSHRSLKQAIEDAEAAGVAVYTLSTREDVGVKSDADRILEVLAERSGGEALFPGDMSALDKSLDKLHDLIRSRYLVAYKPADFTPDGKYRAIHLTAHKDGKRLQVHVRKGYFARVASPH